MRKILLILCLGLIGLVPLLLSFQNTSKISPSLMAALQGMKNTDSVMVWIYFKDKSVVSGGIDKNVALSDACLLRRMKRANNNALTDEFDAPVNASYIAGLTDNGFRLKQVSRWLNAVSGRVNRNDLLQIERLSFVANIDRVRLFQGSDVNRRSKEKFLTDRPLYKTTDYDSMFYGYAYRPLKMLNMDQVHTAGFCGQDVRIAVFDAGFNNLAHEVFDSLHVVATRDFVNGDSSVADDPGQQGDGSHGTQVLSVLAGYKPGKMVGPAFRSEYILAKTENTESEHPIEEDNWIAALEWAEGYGADIVSSSVGYIEFDSSGNNHYDSSAYNWTWMTGNSTRITKAANIAVQKGMIVVNSAGNEGYHDSHNTLGAPADGDNVIAVGSVNYTGIRASSSSVGPTTKGRVKPDVMAMGENVVTAATHSTTGYFIGQSGTSFACPLIAGVCAAMLSAHPEWTPVMVYNALIKTASRAKSPNREYGYGMVNAFRAMNHFVETEPAKDYLYQNYPNPFNTQTAIRYYLIQDGRLTLTIYNILGQKVIEIYRGVQSKGFHQVNWNGRDSHGSQVASGLYICRLKTGNYSKSKKILYVK